MCTPAATATTVVRLCSSVRPCSVHVLLLVLLVVLLMVLLLCCCFVW
jgi:hypothetical protein